MYVYIYVCLYMYVCMYVYIYVFMYVCMYVYIYVFMYVCMYVCIYIYVCMYVCIYVNKQIYAPLKQVQHVNPNQTESLYMVKHSKAFNISRNPKQKYFLKFKNVFPIYVFLRRRLI